MLRPNDKPYIMARRRYMCCHSECASIRLILHFCFMFIGGLTVLPRGSTQLMDDSFTVKPTPALQLGEEELMTIVLLKNDNSRTGGEQSRGRFINVRPEIGLLTSTARTFIQEGITTEYATQVVGTTLDSGRLYAQFLKKSSRVLYKEDNESGPSVITSWVGEPLTQGESILNTLSKNLLQSHNDVFNAEKPDWRAIDDDIFLNLRDFVVNTDFVQVRNTHASLHDDIQPSWTLMPSTGLSTSPYSIPANLTQLVSLVDMKVPTTPAEKVLPIADLPTYTVKHHYEPSGYFRNDSVLNANRDARNEVYSRNGKLIYKEFHSDNEKASNKISPTVQSNEAAHNYFSTITYYGFADFTTVVGDSIIVFSPGTARSSHETNANVTSIKGEATLDVISFQLTQVGPAEAGTAIHNFSARNFQSEILNMNSVIIPKPFSKTSLTTPSEKHTSTKRVALEPSGHSLKEALIKNFTLFPISVSATTPIEENLKLSHPSNDQILDIFTALVIVETDTLMATLAPKTSFNESNTITYANVETNPSTLGGATTIFFEDDPFTNFLAKSNLDPILIPFATRAFDQKQTVERSFADQPIESSMEIFTTDNFYSSVRDISTILKNEPRAINNSAATGIAKTIPDSIIREIKSKDKVDIDACIRTSQVFLTQTPRIITELITSANIHNTTTEPFQEMDSHIVGNFEIGSATKYYCVQTTRKYDTKNEEEPIVVSNLSSFISIETPTKSIERITVSIGISENEANALISDIASTRRERKDEETLDGVLSELPNLFESPTFKEIASQLIVKDLDLEPVTEIQSKFSGNILETDEEDEIELIYKTLYTTYTYLTTYFHEIDTSISSHTEVVTNIITSTLNDKRLPLTQLVENKKKSEFTSFSAVSRYTLSTELDTYIQSEEKRNADSEEYFAENAEARTEINADTAEQRNFFRTFYTTYTYYTTIFADNETEIMSHTEIHTNFVKPTKASKTSKTQTSLYALLPPQPNEHISPSEATLMQNKEENALGSHGNKTNKFTSGERHVSIISDIGDSSAVTFITDVRSSSSIGEQHVIDQEFYLKLSDISEPNQSSLDDQVSSESNTDDEVLPSATLLLQTSFTTFTYYTTMYSGRKTNIISHLETITNTHTETLKSSKTLNLDETSLPITYFTTFTYWTKLARDGQITTVSREETVSNVVIPTKVFTEEPAESNITTSPLYTYNIESSSDYLNQTQPNIELSGYNVGTDVVFSIVTSVLKPTTYYTTYTFYTTSYELDNTITDSHLETVTNAITPTLTLTPAPFARQTTTAFLELLPSSTARSDKASISILAYDLKKIIDADGISTLFFTTQIQSTVDQHGKFSEFVNSTSTLYVDEVKKALLSTMISSERSGTDIQKQHKTGLVRLIEGTRTGNKTTTLYQSRVIGTIIDQRYAQIIESTSSFIFEHSSDLPDSSIRESNTLTNSFVQSIQRPTIGMSDSSLIEGNEERYRFDYKLNESEMKDIDRTSPPYLTQSKKRVFTPTIRPFASRNRPQFAPKKSSLFPSSATIITRSDFTPTITATPALKSSSRFTSFRYSSNPSSTISGYGSARRFGRLGKPPSSSIELRLNRINAALSQQSFRINVSTNLRRLSGSVNRPTLSGIFSSSDNRFSRLKPPLTQTQNLDEMLTSVLRTGANSNSQQNDEENLPLHDENDVNDTLSLLNRQNKLRARRPLSNGSSATPVRSPYSNVSPGFLRRLSRFRSSTVTTTTSIPTTLKPRPKSFQRHVAASTFQNRSRFSNSLFPTRNIFGTQRPFIDQVNSQNSEDTPSFDENLSKGNENDEDSEYEEEDEDEILEEDDVEDIFRRRRSSKKSSLSFFTDNENWRAKREADNTVKSVSNFRNRFRRPMKTSAIQAETRSYADQNADNNNTFFTARTNAYARKRVGSRLNGRLQNLQSTSIKTESLILNRPIRPTRPTSGARAQFTLREKDSTTTTPRTQKSRAGFRRSQPGAAMSIYPSVSSTLNTTNGHRRLKTKVDSLPHTRDSISTRTRTGNLASGRVRTTSPRNSANNRARTNNDIKSELLIFDNSDTITVTYRVPTSVTVPIVDGKVTEYKLLVTAKTYSEVLGPKQYTSFTNVNGQTQLVLTREDSSVNYVGETKLTQYFLHEKPTTTVTFTPTTIRGRKTSFSHILPSTVYSVEEVVSTIQPKISPNVPLANILLSQLLLGQGGLQTANPLLEALSEALTQSVGLVMTSNINPVTEYRTHASTYITTVYEGKSTILPVTFQGKKILTTIYDTTAQTITATEFITDTIITTPTLMPQILPQTQIAANSLLLQQLLLPQQVPHSDVSGQLGAALLNIIPSRLYLNGESLQQLEAINNVRLSNRGRDLNDDDDIASGSGLNIDDITLVAQTHNQKPSRKKARKSGKSHKRKPQVEPVQPQSSVVTLYLSGRRPGEFSTVLSTVPVRLASTLYKRHATAIISSLCSTDRSEHNDYVATQVTFLNKNEAIHATETLESIVGDVLKLHTQSLAARLENSHQTESG
ncbi:uncharacterized protein LOC119643743 [Glossina fuscipes]|uniref:Uncharacterized protein LOC119643743 n=1 Tax=Glossina fuscipes TaxID=7396 RepID=A0A9C5ZM96_9MUSC|nr:uncharacterized protein LOC119643743 [Glossina fuscipes]